VVSRHRTRTGSSESVSVTSASFTARNARRYNSSDSVLRRRLYDREVPGLYIDAGRQSPAPVYHRPRVLVASRLLRTEYRLLQRGRQQWMRGARHATPAAVSCLFQVAIDGARSRTTCERYSTFQSIIYGLQHSCAASVQLCVVTVCCIT